MIKSQKSPAALPNKTKQAGKVKSQKYRLKLKTKIKPDIRYLNDMRMVLYDQKWAKSVPNFPVYYMYRGVKKRGQLRYDITILLPRKLGKEFPKTLGHEHSKNYQELYQVLSGKAIFLLQKIKKKKIIDVKAIKAGKGEAVIISPGYGHLTINPGKEILKIGNWISKKCRNIYNLFQRKRGACYYFTKKGWIKNKNYDLRPKGLRSKKKVPKIRFEKPLKKMPKNLDFLKGE